MGIITRLFWLIGGAVLFVSLPWKHQDRAIRELIGFFKAVSQRTPDG